MTISLLIGALVGFGISMFCVSRSRRWFRREMDASVKSSGEIADSYYAFTDSICRDALRTLEAGKTEEAKKQLAEAIANFYHAFPKLLDTMPDSKHLAHELRMIEHDAKTSEHLKKALNRGQNEPAA